MRKNICIALIGLLSGIGLFISFESLNPCYVFIVAGIISLILSKFDNKILIFPLALAVGFISASYKLDSYKLIDYQRSNLHITILEKRKVNDKYRYFVNARAKGISEKAVLFSQEDLDISDEYLIDGEIYLANKNTNPNLFNYRNYLLSKDITANIDIKKIYKKNPSNSPSLKARSHFYNYIHSIFEENLDDDRADFVISVLLGENLIQNDDILDLGLAHILAVSGLHLELLIAFILYCFRKLNLNYRLGYIFALLISLLYAYLIAFPFTVIRVLIINAIGFLAFLYQYPEDKIKSLMVVALLILLFKPFAILNTGFVLSFVASSGVYLLYPKVKKYIGKNLFAQSIAFTASIQAIILPFIIYYYRRINLLSILANFLIVPIFTLSMYLIFILVLTYPLLKIILSPAFILLDYLVNSIINMSFLLNKLKFLTVEFTQPNIFASIYLYLLIIVSVYMKKSNKKIIKEFYIISLSILIFNLSYESLSSELSFSMIDIGQGDAFLLNERGKYYLIDTGGPKYDNYDSGEKVLIPYLKSLGIKDIEAVFISHEDRDHSGNIAILNENFNVKNIITNKNNIETLINYQPKIIKNDDIIKLSDGYIKCVFEGESDKENDQSLGLLININGKKILTLGDLSTEYEDSIKEKADILKISHHGSKTSTSRKFVEDTKPKVALISAGRNNMYGHPSPEVIDNLNGVKIYNTQKDGMVKIYFEKDVRIEKYLKGGFFK